MNDDHEHDHEQDRHRQQRSWLGAYALGHLDGDQAAGISAHLDGCAQCRAEMVEIAPLVGFLDTIDPDRFTSPPTPPPGLGERIRDAVAHERLEQETAHAVAQDADELAGRRESTRRRRLASVRLSVAAAAVVAVALVGGLLVGRSTAPDPAPTAAPGPFETISLRDVADDSLQVSDAGIVPHTWGVELKFTGTGFDAGQTYRAAFRMDSSSGRAGQMVPAGQFQGVGAASINCDLQSSVLRSAVDRVVVTDSDGEPVLVADL